MLSRINIGYLFILSQQFLLSAEEDLSPYSRFTASMRCLSQKMPGLLQNETQATQGGEHSKSTNTAIDCTKKSFETQSKLKRKHGPSSQGAQARPVSESCGSGTVKGHTPTRYTFQFLHIPELDVEGQGGGPPAAGDRGGGPSAAGDQGDPHKAKAARQSTEHTENQPDLTYPPPVSKPSLNDPVLLDKKVPHRSALSRSQASKAPLQEGQLQRAEGLPPSILAGM